MAVDAVSRLSGSKQALGSERCTSEGVQVVLTSAVIRTKKNLIMKTIKEFDFSFESENVCRLESNADCEMEVTYTDGSKQYASILLSQCMVILSLVQGGENRMAEKYMLQWIAEANE